MVYASSFVYITLHWSTTMHADERGQTGIKVPQGAMPNSTDRETIRAAAEAMWENSLMHISNSFELESVKFAVVEPNGLYDPDTEAEEVFMPATVVGGVATANTFPLQSAHVLTLRTAKPRGIGSKGRMYFPPIQGTFTNGLYFTTGNCLNRANTLKTFLDAVNTTLTGSVSVMSKVGAGLSQPVTTVSVGQRIDVQRRRARQADEGVLQTSTLA